MKDFYEHIDDFMDGLLEGEALRAFEAELKTNNSLRIAVENYDSAKAISEGLLEVDMMETLKGLKEAKENQSEAERRTQEEARVRQLAKKDSEVEPKKQSFNFSTWLVAAAMLVAIAFTGWWVMEMNEAAKYKKYVLNNYEKPIDEDATKSVDTIGMDNFEKGKHFFALNDYEVSVPFLEKYLLEISDENLKSEAYEWLGAAYLNIWRIEDAKEALGKSREEKAKRNLELLLQIETKE